jgi:hypothetical protein
MGSEVIPSPIDAYRPGFIAPDVILIELKAQHWPMTMDDMLHVFDYSAAAANPGIRDSNSFVDSR